MTYYESNQIRKKTLKKKAILKKYYESVASKNIDLTSPYIICALAYQPEKTTSPLGGYFSKQLLMIELLRKAMPVDWKLYVKDHIYQFTWNAGLGEKHRSKEYYAKIKALPNTELVPLFQDTFSLVDNCKAVATVTGSIGFEAIVRGKPVLTFGHSWYKFCEGELYSGNYQDLLQHIEKIKAGYTPDSNKVNQFIETIQEHTFEGIVGGGNITRHAGEKGNPNINAEAHIKSIISLLTYNEKH